MARMGIIKSIRNFFAKKKDDQPDPCLPIPKSNRKQISLNRKSLEEKDKHLVFVENKHYCYIAFSINFHFYWKIFYWCSEHTFFRQNFGWIISLFHRICMLGNFLKSQLYVGKDTSWSQHMYNRNNLVSNHALNFPAFEF